MTLHASRMRGGRTGTICWRRGRVERGRERDGRALLGSGRFDGATMPNDKPDAHPIPGRLFRTAFRQCSKTAALAATGYLNEGPLFLFDYLLRLLRVAMML